MNICMHMIIMLIVSIIVIPVEAMEKNGVLVKTSDNKDCWLPQWQIEESRVLCTKKYWREFQEKYYGVSPAPIKLKTIDQEKLQLFSDALDASDFSGYVNKLLDAKKNLLLSLARPQELDSWYIMSQFLTMYGIQDLVAKYMSTTEIADYLQGLVIADNCKNKTFTRTPITKYTSCLLSNFISSYQCNSTLYTGYYNLPSLFTSSYTRFSGITNPSLISFSHEVDKSRLIQNCVQSKNKTLNYFLTSIDPVDNNSRYEQMFIEENKKKLWAITCETNAEAHKIIEHSNPIELSVFSNDGKYLATVSSGQHGELILSDLTVNNNKFIGFDVLLTGHTGWIGPVCFNKKSTIVAAASEKFIYMWDVHKKALLQRLDCLQGIIEIISFNHDDSRFVTIAFDTDKNASVIKLWDSTYTDYIRTIVWHEQCVTGISFTPSGDKLIIETKTGVMILNGMSGEVIMEVTSINQAVDHERSCVNAVLMPYSPMLVTMAHNDNNECTVALWDINTQERIACLMENQKDLVGIGLSSGGRYVHAVNYYFSMITMELYDEFVKKSLEWIDKKMNCLQRYLLMRLYKAHKNNDSVFLHPDSPEYKILQNFPAESCKVKEMIEKYLLKKDNKENT